MEIKLHQLEIVLCIAPELSFSKPAENWESASQVSVQIKNLGILGSH